MASQENDSSPRPLTRWYMDMRKLTETSSSLPLLETLRPSDQKTVRAFFRLPDRHMSLASYLLKYLFIHRTCRVPWNEITISRTPDPHRRPCYFPVDNGEAGSQVSPIEFNVSHQASLVALAGCVIPEGDANKHSNTPNPEPTGNGSDDNSIAPPQIGIDITCTDERERRGSNSLPNTETDVRSFIDIFTEAFSTRELDIIKSGTRVDAPLEEKTNNDPRTILEKSIQYRIRLFYTYWALKEAYIKMVGEGLLASWLRELEFTNVIPPMPSVSRTISGDDNSADDISGAWGTPQRETEILLHGKPVDDVRMELVAFEEKYIVATATRGAGFGKTSTRVSGPGSQWDDFKRLDIERDIGPCARGECLCLS